MIFIKQKAIIKKKNIYGENVLHYACRTGSTISALTLINEGADLEIKSIHGNTPFAYALINGHEDLCIFLIQSNSKVNVDVFQAVLNKQNPLNQLSISETENITDSKEVFEMMKEKKSLLKENEFVQEEKDLKKIKANSPFFYAINKNMHGNIFLMLQKGFDHFKALQEALKLSKYNLFFLLLDSVNTKVVKEVNAKKQSLLHTLAKYNLNSADDSFMKVFDYLVNE